jgi:hypothetical protein
MFGDHTKKEGRRRTRSFGRSGLSAAQRVTSERRKKKSNVFFGGGVGGARESPEEDEEEEMESDSTTALDELKTMSLLMSTGIQDCFNGLGLVGLEEERLSVQ